MSASTDTHRNGVSSIGTLVYQITDRPAELERGCSRETRIEGRMSQGFTLLHPSTTGTNATRPAPSLMKARDRRTSDENESPGRRACRPISRSDERDGPGRGGKPGGRETLKDESPQAYQRRAGKGCGDAVRLRTGGLLRGVSTSRGRFYESRNAMNSIIGSRMQQACDFRVGQTVETVRNREDGTLETSVNTREHVDRGAKEPQERKAVYRLGRQGDALRRGAGRGG